MRQTTGPVTRFLRLTCALAAAAMIAACASAPPPAPAAGGAKPSGEAPKPQSKVVATSGPVTVALLAPTTASGGRVRAAAQDLTAAAQMARQDRAGPDLLLKIYDTHATEAGARAAAEKAVAEGAALIVGPLTATATRAVAPVASSGGVPVLSFSNDASVAGDNVWVLGQLPGTELERVMSYAAAQGVRDIAIVYPTNRYGQAIAGEAAAAGARAGVGVGPFLSYERSFQGIEGATKSGAGDIRGAGVDGVLIADAGDALRSTGAFLNYYDVSPRNYRYLGTSRWADPKNATEPSLVGGWYAAADPAARQAFVSRFEAELGRKPSPLAVIGYDGMAAAAAMLSDARAGGDATPFDPSAITRPGGFSGAAGRFSLTSDGRNRRGLAVMEVTQDGMIVVDPAPTAAPGA